MRILYVSHTSEVSGGERSLLDLLGGLPGDVEPVVACPDGQLAEAVHAMGIATRRLPGTQLSLKLHPRHTTAAAAQLARSSVSVRRASKEVAADVVHANAIRAGLITAGAKLLRGPPSIVHVRDRLPQGRASRLSLAAIGRGNDLIVANSRYTAASMAGIASRASQRVVANPVDLERFDPSRIDARSARTSLRLPQDAVILAVVAQITPWKGQDDAIRIAALLRGRGHDVRLLVVGAAKFVDGARRYDNRTYRDSLDTLVDELGLGENVVFAGELEDVPRVLRATDVLLVPSWEEPFGRTVIEAMAMGTPVVATDVGGPAETITDGEDGILLAPRRPELWADAVGGLLADPPRLAVLAERGVLRAQSFSRERHVAAIVALYLEVASSRA